MLKMHIDTVSKNLLATLNALMKDTRLADFVLVGGTALSLQVGHRMSADIDMFCPAHFNKEELRRYLIERQGLRLSTISDIALHGFIGNVKVDFVHYENAFLYPAKLEEGIRMASLEDIAVMKLEAITNTQNRLKDYVDIAFLSEHVPLAKMLEGFKKKFGEDETYALRSLSTFNRVNAKDDIFLMRGMFEWKKVIERISEMIDKPSALFKAIDFPRAKPK
jgi:Nucleotidyl transferase AbiEii toxin, Type IV TA system